MQRIENRESFFNRLKGKFSNEDLRDIEFAYDLAKVAHRNQIRKTGERYFEHLRDGCLVLLDELQIFNRNLLISFLLHDACEDTAIFGNIKSEVWADFETKAYYRIEKLFGKAVAQNVFYLTKPEIDNAEFHSKDKITAYYIKRLNALALFLKMIDCLCNLRTIVGCNESFIRKQFIETKEVYLPLFRSFDDDELNQEAKLLIDKIEKQLEIIKNLHLIK